MILSGGAYLDPAIAKDLLRLGIVVLQGYGITECSPSISCNRNEDFSLESVGIILPGQRGQICGRRNSRARLFHDERVLQAARTDGRVPDEDGRFKTGDLGYLDKKGHLHIVGRKKNLIVMKNGKKVSAEEMENELREARPWSKRSWYTAH